MNTWRDRAHRVIGALCRQSYLAANTRKDGKRYKTHRPYSVPESAQLLVDALGRDDEVECKRLMLFDYHAAKALTRS